MEEACRGEIIDKRRELIDGELLALLGKVHKMVLQDCLRNVEVDELRLSAAVMMATPQGESKYFALMVAKDPVTALKRAGKVRDLVHFSYAVVESLYINKKLLEAMEEAMERGVGLILYPRRLKCQPLLLIYAKENKKPELPEEIVTELSPEKFVHYISQLI